MSAVPDSFERTASRQRRPRRGTDPRDQRPMIFRDLYTSRELLRNLVLRDLRGRYKRSALGILWSLINPLASLLIYATVFRHMMQGGTDFTLLFRRLTQVAGGADEAVLTQLFATPEEAATFTAHWRERAGPSPDVDAMRRANPVYIARNHRVEEALAAANAGDLAPTRRLLNVLATPYSAQDGCEDLEQPPSDEEEVRQTFCGT